MDASSQAGGSPNGTSNASTGSTVHSNSSPTDQKDASAKSKKKPARGKEVVVVQRADKLLEKSSAHTKDAMVARLVEEVRSDRLDVVQAAGAPVVDRQALADKRKIVSAARKATWTQFMKLKKCVDVTAAGQSFIKRSKASTLMDTVRTVASEITPELLQHNGPLLKKVTELLAEFDRQNEEYVAVKKTASDSKAELRQAIKRLSLSLNALQGVIFTIESTAAREALVASRKAKQSKRAA